MSGPVVIVGTDTPQPPDWSYQPPECPEKYPSQRYYREPHPRQWEGAKVFRFANDMSAQLTLRVPGASVEMALDAAALTCLRDAINDALVDISVAAIEAERQASFDRICDEIRDAGDEGTGCYYAHPDVHYVPADQCASKVAELTAARAPRFIVLPDPAAVAVAA